MSRIRLRTRVYSLTGAFALVLIAVTFGLSWRARDFQQRWSRLIAVETEAVASLDEIIRAQNAFRAQRSRDVDRYRAVEQLLERPALKEIDTTALRVRTLAFRQSLKARDATRAEIDRESTRISAEAQRIIEQRKREIARQLPMLEREAREMMSTGLAVSWIIVVLAVAAAKTMRNRVLRPLEHLSSAAKRINAGDLDTKVPVSGDREIFEVGEAFNQLVEELKQRARTDDLTSLPNFRAFREHIDAEISRASRYRLRFGILVLDLDRFKRYNDNFGHLAGNEALQRVAAVIRQTVRGADFAARYGGEEFAVIVPQTDMAALGFAAERIRSGVEALSPPPGGAMVTISIGAALFPVDGGNAETLFQAADERLYEAKRLGRNRVVLTTPQAAQSAS